MLWSRSLNELYTIRQPIPQSRCVVKFGMVSRARGVHESRTADVVVLL